MFLNEMWITEWFTTIAMQVLHTCDHWICYCANSVYNCMWNLLNGTEYITFPVTPLLLMLCICSWEGTSLFLSLSNLYVHYVLLAFCYNGHDISIKKFIYKYVLAYSSCVNMKAILLTVFHNKTNHTSQIQQSDWEGLIQWHLCVVCCTALAHNLIMMTNQTSVCRTLSCFKWPVEYAPQVWPLCGGTLCI
jgi:hypothetical protein